MKHHKIFQIFCFVFICSILACSHKKYQSNDFSIPKDTTQFNFPGYIIYDDRLKEISGVVMSRHFSEALWVHNDSGDKSQIYLISTKGKTLATFPLPNVKVRDVEDIAIGPGPKDKVNYIYLGDIGDNWSFYNTKYIYRFPEPQKYVFKKNHPIQNIEKISFRLPDKRRDTETLLIDHLTKDIYIISKWEQEVQIYKLPYPQSTKDIITAQQVGSLPFSKINAGDISADGQEILIKNYSHIFYWQRKNNEPIEKTLQSKPVRLPYIFEPQGEAIAWRADGNGYYTISESPDNGRSNLFFFARQKNKK